MYALLDYDCLLPEFVNITTGRVTDNKVSFDLPVAPHSVVVADRGYCNFELLNYWNGKKVFFVVCHKDNLLYERVWEPDLPAHSAQDVLIDEIIELKGINTSEKYPHRLRRIAVRNDEHQFTVQILTNNLQLVASTITKLYKERRQIEIFFRNLRQLLRIKSFIGTSENAVQAQIWTVMTTMFLLCWLKQIAKYKWALANLVVSLRLNTFTKIFCFFR